MAPEETDVTPEHQERISDLFSRLKSINFYDLLGVPRDADKKTIKRAYQARVLDFHPDRFFRKRLGTFKPKMEAIFVRMTEAEEILTSPDRRAKYDAALQANRHSIIDDMLEEAMAEMSGPEHVMRDRLYEISKEVEVVSKPPPPSAPSIRPMSPAEIEARRQTLARKLSPHPFPGVKSSDPPKK
jgi:hypothetical protein